MKTLLVAALGLAALVGARAARSLATEGVTASEDAPPYAPSAGAAPFVSLGYRELLADLMWVRMRGYFGGDRARADGIADLVEAVAAADPQFRKVYEKGALAITGSAHADRKTYERALALLEAGMTVFPEDWKMPLLAGQIYLIDLQTTDPAQRRAWDERGALLLESAVRKPHAPQTAATIAATVRTKLGQHERAVENLRELAVITTNEDARTKLLEKLAELENGDVAGLAAEIDLERRAFNQRWLAERPALSPTNYLVLGPRLPRRFDLGDLALGGRAVIEAPPEPLEPLTD